MKHKVIWLDDIRNPFEIKWTTLIFDNIPIKNISNIKIIWLKNYDEFENFIKNEYPYMIFFDHDLGAMKTGYDAAKLLVNKCLDDNTNLPFWYIQSSNPPGKKNINKLLTNFKKFNDVRKKG